MSFKEPDFHAQVAQHYNQVEQKPVRERAKSDIIKLRKFNNAMKSLMIYTACKYSRQTERDREPLRVLDLGCGKGGDLKKYFREEDRVGLIVGVDVADKSIEQCKERFESIHQPGRRMKGEFFVADLTKTEIRPRLRELHCDEKFHIAACQFSIHYSFGSFDHAVRYISNAADNLIRHGFFIGTYPDGPKLLKLARQSKTPGLYEVEDILSVRFEPEDLSNPQPFGTKYHFKLKEVVDCPEFLVHPEVLRRLMKELGFYEVFDRSFEENLREAVNNRSDRGRVKKIFENHDALDIDFEEKTAFLDKDMWAAASIYRCFCYRKTRDD